MTEMEHYYRNNEILNTIEKRLSEIYPLEMRNGEKVFLISGTDTAHVVQITIKGTTLYVIEYACGDDGEEFIPSDYQSIDEMI